MNNQPDQRLPIDAGRTEGTVVAPPRKPWGGLMRRLTLLRTPEFARLRLIAIVVSLLAVVGVACGDDSKPAATAAPTTTAATTTAVPATTSGSAPTSAASTPSGGAPTVDGLTCPPESEVATAIAFTPQAPVVLEAETRPYKGDIDGALILCDYGNVEIRIERFLTLNDAALNWSVQSGHVTEDARPLDDVPGDHKVMEIRGNGGGIHVVRGSDYIKGFVSTTQLDAADVEKSLRGLFGLAEAMLA